MPTAKTISSAKISVALLLSLFVGRSANAQVFGTVRVSAADQQDLAVPSADVTIKSATTAWMETAKTNTTGEALFAAVPAGRYVVTVTSGGFNLSEKQIDVASNAVTPVRLQLEVAGVTESVQVAVAAQTVNPESSRTETLVARADILKDPGADSAGSMAMITNNSPGAYMLHDHLHSRGGHGVSWEIDGVPVPSSAMAVVGSQFDPKDVDLLEVNRGGLATSTGDRPYGVFNVVPRSGFEGDRFGDVTGTVGNYSLGNLHVALGDHSKDQKFAYFASASGNTTGLGLERVDTTLLHDDAHAFTFFTSLLYNKSTHDQFRFVGSERSVNHQVPNVVEQQVLGIDDRELGNDGFGNFTWLRTSDSGSSLIVSPYYHYNRQQYLGGSNDPLITHDDTRANYLGAMVTFSTIVGKHTLRVGTDSYAEHDNLQFGLRETTGDLREATQNQLLWSNVTSIFVEDSYRTASWLTLNGGLRFERFAGTITENATSPRLGTAISIPHVGVLRASYSQYYEHPPTATISGPVLDFALNEGFGFLPLHGERDKVVEVGLGIPVKGWTVDLDAYRNMVENFGDHDVLGNSNLLLPLSIAEGRVRAFESTLRSPVLFKRLQLHYAFAYQIAEARGAVTGGMTDFRPANNNDYFYLDHDQRVTFNSGATLNLPQGFWVSETTLFGSGFLLVDGPDHLPSHTTADIAVGKTLNERVQVRFTATNVANATYLTGFENSFAGTHYGYPRQVSVQVQYKFHY